MSVSSFISSSNAATALLAQLHGNWGIGSWWVLCYALLAALFLVCSGILAWKWKRMRPPWRALSVFVILVLAVRMALFYNPVAWRYWERTRTPDKVGYIRHTFMLMQQHRHFARDIHPKQTEYVAFGTSQIWAVFGAAADASDQLEAFSLPGLGPWGYDLYRDIIKGYNPKTVILYVSEFDLAHAPIWEALEFAPPTFEYLKKLRYEQSINRLGENPWKAFGRLAARNLFPEVKYAFLFRTPLEQKMGHGVAFPQPEETSLTHEELLQTHFANLKRQLKRENMEPNLHHLSSFVDYCVAQGIRVVIVEGQYHPDAPIEGRKEMHDFATQRMAQIASQRKSVAFLPRASIMPFYDTDYIDGYHVSQESGKRFCEILAERLTILEKSEW